MSKIKLSDKQKEIISLMQGGKELCTTFFSTGSPTCIDRQRVSEATFSKLSNLGLITLDRTTMSTKSTLSRTYWKLTELGKTLNQ